MMLSDASAEIPSKFTKQECCKICGDSIGCGMNFGCISCESCKAFFRRSCSKSGKNQQLCPFSGKCQITKASRKACPACRLEKCIQMGMRMEMVDAWKKQWAKENGQKQEEKGNRRRNVPRKRKKTELFDGNSKVCICKCQCGANENGQIGIEKATQTEETLAEKSVEFDNIEKRMLDELNRASLILDSPIPTAQHFGPFNLTLIDAFRASEFGMRRMVAMCKQIAAFRALDSRDQIALLRNSLLGLLILRGAMAFDSRNEAWRHAILNGTGGQQLPFCLNLNVLPPKEQHSEEHRRFLMTFNEKWRTNRRIMLILHAIALFTVPNGILLVSKEIIEESEQKYCGLLKRCLWMESSRGNNIDQAFGHLMGKLEELGRLSRSFQQFYCRLNTGELGESLLRELLLATK